MENLTEIYAQFDTEIVSPIVDILMEKYYQHPPRQSLIPEPAWKARTRQELMDIVGQKQLRERIERGFNLLYDALNKQLSDVEMEQIKEELDHGLMELNKSEPDSSASKKETPLAMAETIPLSDGTIEKFYQCGMKLYEAEHLQEAADLFFVLNIFDFRRHNIWMALGICEQKLQNWDPALTAFSMAILTNPKAHLPYVNSATCYYALGMRQDVIECLDAAIAAISTYSPKEDRQLIAYIAELRNKVRS